MALGLNTVCCLDCLEGLKCLEDDSVDSIVSDPPYGISFMGKRWDYNIPGVDVWQECLRVLKPGGHALVACGTRTQHRMAVNLEDAGFVIRDLVAWVYGSGFPKSLNIGKAVDKLQGNERELVGYNKEYLKKKNAEIERGIDNTNISYQKGGLTNKQAGYQNPEDGAKITKGSSKFEGWGTALKPAMELWTLCRKPLEEGTVAANVLRYGVGGLNIDGCRINPGEKIQGGGNGKNSENISFTSKVRPKVQSHTQGRFPANLIHDGCREVLDGFPDSKSQRSNRGNINISKMAGGSGQSAGTDRIRGHNDSGSASRFFYCAKASKSERSKGLEESNNHPTVKPIKLMRYLCKLITPSGGTVLDPYAGSGSTGVAAKLEGFDFIGFEREEEYCRIANKRLGEKTLSDFISP